MSETPASRNLRITITQQWPDERPGPKVDPVTIGEQVSGSQSLDEIVVVYDGDTAFMRLHIYYPQAEYHLKTLAIVWADRRSSLDSLVVSCLSRSATERRTRSHFQTSNRLIPGTTSVTSCAITIICSFVRVKESSASAATAGFYGRAPMLDSTG